jgi:hypothetical protein
LAYCALLGGKHEAIEFNVTLDAVGTFRLCGANDASIAFVETADLVAFYDRTGGNDPVLDCLALALGVTPLCNGALSWCDVPQLRLLSIPFPLRALCWLIPALTSTESRYERHWNILTQRWRQTGYHSVRFARFPIWSCRTTANLNAEAGVSAITLTVEGKPTAAIEAKLNGIGMRGDRGIPEWISQW